MGSFRLGLRIANWLRLGPALAQRKPRHCCKAPDSGKARPLRSARSAAGLIAIGLLAATSAVAQVVFEVNDFGDDIDANVLDGKCETPLPAKTCTLRAAVMQANRIPNAGATINLPAGTYKLTIPASIADGEENGDLNLVVPAGYSPGPTTIAGAGAGTTIIDGLGQTRILKIDAMRTAVISGVALINGYVLAASGGGIYNEGELHLTHSLVKHNSAEHSGGGLYTSTTVDVSFSVFSLNSAGEGGAIYASAGTTSVSQSTLDGNSAGEGGGIYSSTTVKVDRSTLSRNVADYGGALKSNGELVVTNSTISQNHGTVGGGGIYSVSTTSIYNSTIAYNQISTAASNSGEDGGAGIQVTSSSTFDLHNSILAGNLLVPQNFYADCVGLIGLYGVNGYEGGVSCFGRFDSPGIPTQVDSASELGILKDNGGPTETIGLISSSGLIGGGIAAECAGPGGHFNSDQRGNPRPPPGSACDIGAFEFNELFANGFETAP